MKAIMYIAYILAGLFIIFGALFILAAFGEVFTPGWLFTGIVLVGIGFGLIIAGYFVGRRASQAAAKSSVTLNIDLPADVNLDTLKCQSCGGSLTTDNIKMVAGAPVVDCPYCHTTYQLTEEPKW
ncbi:MAG: hypothetical protein PVF74_11040 [Anaerolineales bacterium]